MATEFHSLFEAKPYPTRVISNYHDHMKRLKCLKLQRAKFTFAGFSKMTFPANALSNRPQKGQIRFIFFLMGRVATNERGGGPMRRGTIERTLLGRATRLPNTCTVVNTAGNFRIFENFKADLKICHAHFMILMI